MQKNATTIGTKKTKVKEEVNTPDNVDPDDIEVNAVNESQEIDPELIEQSKKLYDFARSIGEPVRNEISLHRIARTDCR